MKRIVCMILSSCMFAAGLTVVAQEKSGTASQKLTPEQMLQFRAQKVAADLMLDDKTAKDFLPVYKEYLSDKMALYKDVRKPVKPSGNQKQKMETKQQKPAYNPAMSDEDALKYVERALERRQNKINQDQRLLDIDKKYKSKFEKILNPKQLKKLYDMNHPRPQYQQKGRSGHAPGRHQPFNRQAPVRK